MKDITDKRLLWLKGMLFVVTALVASGLILLESPGVRTALLLLIAIWASCRAYYFAFYVIEHYVDPTFKFSGLGSFLRYALRRR
jgi:hypothetical protein